MFGKRLYFDSGARAVYKDSVSAPPLCRYAGLIPAKEVLIENLGNVRYDMSLIRKGGPVNEGWLRYSNEGGSYANGCY